MTFEAPIEDLEIDSGDDETFVITRKKSNDSTYDITDWTFWLTIKKKIGHSDTNAALQKKVTTHSDPTNGETRIDVTGAETSNLAGSYRYDIQEKQNDSTVNTIVKGTLYVHDDVTEAT